MNFSLFSRYLAALGVLVTAIGAFAQEAALPMPPTIPANLSVQHRTALENAARLLAMGEFDSAKQLLDQIARKKETHVLINTSTVPAALRPSFVQAANKAVEMWNSAATDITRFVVTNDDKRADLVVQFETVVVRDSGTRRFGQSPMALTCSDTLAPELSVDKPGAATSGPSIARIAVFVQGTAEPHTPQAVTHLVAHELGAYLGLADTNLPDSVMGPDIHGNVEPPKVAAAELTTIREAASVRSTLAGFVANRQRVQELRPTITVEKASLDGGVVAHGTVVDYVFVIKNTGNAPLELNAKPNCGCTVADYDRVILPGQRSEMHAKINTNSFRGPIHKYIDLTTNDPKNPHMNLSMSAVVMPNVRVLPDSPITLNLPDDQPLTQVFTVFARDDMDLQLTPPSSTNPNIKVNVKPWQGSIKDPMAEEEPAKARKGYQVEVTVDPKQPVGRSTEMLVLRSNHPKDPQTLIQLVMEKGIVFQPPAIFFGVVERTPDTPIERAVFLQKRAGEFKIVKAETDDPNIKVQVVPGRNGSEYQVKLTYAGGWTDGFISRRLTITTDSKNQPTISVPIQANVRTTTAPTVNPDEQ